MVWRQLWLHVMDCKMTSLQFMEFLIKQLPLETVEETINFTFANLQTLVQLYIPTAQVAPLKARLFPVLFEQLKSELPQSVRDAIVDSLWVLMADKDHVNMVVEWAKAGNIHDGDKKIYSLSKSHLRKVVAALHLSKHVSD